MVATEVLLLDQTPPEGVAVRALGVGIQIGPDGVIAEGTVRNESVSVGEFIA
jgi:hypothetical protein